MNGSSIYVDTTDCSSVRLLHSNCSSITSKMAETWASTQHIRNVYKNAWQLTISCIAEPVRYRKHLQVAAESCLVTAISVVCTDRKSTRLNSSHLVISYAVFCLKKKKKNHKHHTYKHPTNPLSPLTHFIHSPLLHIS